MTTQHLFALAAELENAMQKMRRLKLSEAAHGCPTGPETFLLTQILRQDNHPVTPTDLSTAFGSTTAAITHHLNALEKAGYIQRQTSQSDRRVIEIHLTSTGRQIAERHRTHFLGMIESLGQEDVQTLITILGKITAYMESSLRSDLGETTDVS